MFVRKSVDCPKRWCKCRNFICNGKYFDEKSAQESNSENFLYAFVDFFDVCKQFFPACLLSGTGDEVWGQFFPFFLEDVEIFFHGGFDGRCG